MTVHDVDILIAGAGLTGLVSAFAFGKAGYRVLCVDPTKISSESTDRRTTAYLQPGQKFLNDLGLWDRVQRFAAPLFTMRIMDAANVDQDPVIRDFKSEDVSELPFGWNISNAQMHNTLVAEIQKLPNVSFAEETQAISIFTRTSQARVTLSDGRKITADLMIAADGRDSQLRQDLNIKCPRNNFDQSALAFAVTHPIPHGNVSTEVHKTGGPFTLVPLPDVNGVPCSGIVWMDDDANIDTILEMSPDALAKAASLRCEGILGPLDVINTPARWPIISQVAAMFYGERTALIGEAAHVVPPIGAQGFNMSLADISCLLELVTAASDPGDVDVLAAYDKKRRRDVEIRAGGISVLNRVSQSDNTLFQGLRRLGLSALHDAKPLRKTVMRMGLGQVER